MIGSNIFNILSILGVCSLVAPIQSAGLRPFDYWFMVGCALLLLPMLWTGRKIVRAEGAILLAAYAAYLFVLWPKD